jgi:arabinose-5-phosphate isomerase
MIGANAIMFSFVPIVVHNWVSPLACIVAGLFFAHSYRQHQFLKMGRSRACRLRRHDFYGRTGLLFPSWRLQTLESRAQNLFVFMKFPPYIKYMLKEAPRREPSKDATLLASGRYVLIAESAALTTLAEHLGASFIMAIRLLMECKGRVVVSGMGKSGHIGRKIAATLASTGTPSLFVHPGEASHGDLGMIVANDVVIALSNSGETAELTDLVAYTRRFSIPLIAITSGTQSSLGGAADATLALPKVDEVCPMGLAPTTSTTMMLALGDALALTILESKGFTADDFRNFHPGGKLGKILLRVSEIMHGPVELPLAQETELMSYVLVTMTQKSFGCAGILDGNGILVGIITDGDLRRHMQTDLLQKMAAQVMTSNPQVIPPTMLAAEALKILNEKKRTVLFVVEGGKPVGIIHVHDLLRAGIA